MFVFRNVCSLKGGLIKNFKTNLHVERERVRESRRSHARVCVCVRACVLEMRRSVWSLT
jgi:hypothetical protein